MLRDEHPSERNNGRKYKERREGGREKKRSQLVTKSRKIIFTLFMKSFKHKMPLKRHLVNCSE